MHFTKDIKFYTADCTETFTPTVLKRKISIA